MESTSVPCGVIPQRRMSNGLAIDTAWAKGRTGGTLQLPRTGRDPPFHLKDSVVRQARGTLLLVGSRPILKHEWGGQERGRFASENSVP